MMQQYLEDDMLFVGINLLFYTDFSVKSATIGKPRRTHNNPFYNPIMIFVYLANFRSTGLNSRVIIKKQELINHSM